MLPLVPKLATSDLSFTTRSSHRNNIFSRAVFLNAGRCQARDKKTNFLVKSCLCERHVARIPICRYRDDSQAEYYAHISIYLCLLIIQLSRAHQRSAGISNVTAPLIGCSLMSLIYMPLLSMTSTTTDS